MFIQQLIFCLITKGPQSSSPQCPYMICLCLHVSGPLTMCCPITEEDTKSCRQMCWKKRLTHIQIHTHEHWSSPWCPLIFQPTRRHTTPFASYMDICTAMGRYTVYNSVNEVYYNTLIIIVTDNHIMIISQFIINNHSHSGSSSNNNIFIIIIAYTAYYSL